MIIPFFAMLESLQIPWLEGDAWHRFPLSLLYWRNWPLYLLGALTIFLTLQFLRLVFRSKPRAQGRARPQVTESSELHADSHAMRELEEHQPPSVGPRQKQ